MDENSIEFKPKQEVHIFLKEYYEKQNGIPCVITATYTQGLQVKQFKLDKKGNPTKELQKFSTFFPWNAIERITWDD